MFIFGGGLACSKSDPADGHYSAQGPEARSKPFLASAWSQVYHRRDCKLAAKINDENLLGYDTAADAEADGFRPCEVCKPTADLDIALDRLAVLRSLSDARFGVMTVSQWWWQLGKVCESKGLILETKEALTEFTGTDDARLTWPFEISDYKAGRKVFFLPRWSLVISSGKWKTDNAIARAVVNGELSEAVETAGLVGDSVV